MTGGSFSRHRGRLLRQDESRSCIDLIHHWLKSRGVLSVHRTANVIPTRFALSDSVSLLLNIGHM